MSALDDAERVLDIARERVLILPQHVIGPRGPRFGVQDFYMCELCIKRFLTVTAINTHMILHERYGM